VVAKTDKVDTEILLRLLAADFIPPVSVAGREQPQLSICVRLFAEVDE